jgi:hypothetical protein
VLVSGHQTEVIGSRKKIAAKKVGISPLRVNMVTSYSPLPGGIPPQQAGRALNTRNIEGNIGILHR